MLGTKINFDEDFDYLMGKEVSIINKKTRLQLDGVVTNIEPSDPGNISEGWYIAISNVNDQYQIHFTTNYWEVYI